MQDVLAKAVVGAHGARRGLGALGCLGVARHQCQLLCILCPHGTLPAMVAVVPKGEYFLVTGLHPSMEAGWHCLLARDPKTYLLGTPRNLQDELWPIIAGNAIAFLCPCPREGREWVFVHPSEVVNSWRTGAILHSFLCSPQEVPPCLTINGAPLLLE